MAKIIFVPRMSTNLENELLPLSTSSSGESLWQTFLKGDQDALGKIYRMHIDDLYPYGMH